MATNDPTIQFYDNYVPKIHAGTYKITVTQTLKDATGKSALSATEPNKVLSNTQKFEVKGPEYQIPAADVHASFPPNNLSGKFEDILPHVVFNKKALPWEHIFDTSKDQVPWIALLALQIGSGAKAEATVTDGAISGITLSEGGTGYHELPPSVSIICKRGKGTAATATVQVNPDGSIQGFTVTNGGKGYVKGEVTVQIGYPKTHGGTVGGANQTGAMITTAQHIAKANSPIAYPTLPDPKPAHSPACQAINVAVSAFQDYMPQYDSATNVDEVSLLAHVRQVSLHDKAELGLTDGWCASLMARRFPVAPSTAVKYAVHVVSLLGLQDYLKPGASFGSANQIQLLSLYSWSFTCQPQDEESFSKLMNNLLKTERNTNYTLSLPGTTLQPGASAAAIKANALVTEGYVPTTYHTRQGEETMALYRSPLTPVLPESIFVNRVTDIEITNNGSGYTLGSAPAVTVADGGLASNGRAMKAKANVETVVQGFTLSSGGSGYVKAPTVTIAPPASGSAATAYAVISDGVVTGLVLTSGGSGYTTAPTVTFGTDAGGTGAVATASIVTQVSSLTITDPGAGYSYPPTVTIGPPDSGTDQAKARAFINDPIGSSTSAAIYNKEWGVFDLSYSSMFLSTRMLALSSKSFAVDVLQWRKEAHQMVNNLYERLSTADSAALEALSPQQIASYLQGKELVTEKFMTQLTGDYAKSLIPKFTQSITTGSLANSEIKQPTGNAATTALSDLKKLMSNGAVQGQLQALSGFDSSTGTFTNDRFKNICEWLANRVMLKGVPFETLVPDERMLPAGSIRFFYLDPNAVEAMIDGALSVGTHSSRDTLYYAIMRGQIRDAVNTLIHQLRANLLGQTPAAPPYQDTPISGMLLRSPVVKGWPGLEVKAYNGTPDAIGTKKIPLLRMSHLSSDILLCLFDGVPEYVEMDEPSEGLTFGVERDKDDNDIIYLRNLTTSPVGAIVSTGTTSINPSTYIEPNSGKLNVTELTAKLQSSLNQGTLGPAGLAIQMVKMPERMVFKTPNS